MAEAVQASAKPPFWRDVRVLRIAGQVLFILIVVVVFREMYLNATYEIDRRGRELDFDFLQTRAGFGIKEHVIDYNPNNSFERAFLVGATNAMFVAAIGITFATILGIFLGVARLSPNWLVRKVSQVYVEAFRNTPLLVQVIFWWGAVFLAIPQIAESISIFGIAYASNRGAAVPAIRGGSDFGTWLLIVLAGLVAASFVWRWRTRVNEETGEPSYRFLASAATVLAISTLGAVVIGEALSIETPELQERNYSGGYQMSTEFAAILVALVIYTGAFIGEIVRGSILAVSKGQKEAAQALGLRPGQQLRLVVLPQAMRIAIPAINNQYLNLWKNTSLAFAIGFPELINVSTTMINQAGSELQIFTMVVLTYLIGSLVLSAVMNLVNKTVALKGSGR